MHTMLRLPGCFRTVATKENQRVLLTTSIIMASRTVSAPTENDILAWASVQP